MWRKCDDRSSTNIKMCGGRVDIVRAAVIIFRQSDQCIHENIEWRMESLTPESLFSHSR